MRIAGEAAPRLQTRFATHTGQRRRNLRLDTVGVTAVEEEEEEEEVHA
jgi:hypothetical protein